MQTFSPEFLAKLQNNLTAKRYVREAWQSLYNDCGDKLEAAHHRGAHMHIITELEHALEKASKALSKARAEEEVCAIKYLSVTGGEGAR